MTENQQPVVAEITHEALARCRAIGHGALDAVEALRAELEKSPALGRMGAQRGRRHEAVHDTHRGHGHPPGAHGHVRLRRPATRARTDPYRPRLTGPLRGRRQPASDTGAVAPRGC
ncbi:hypothetical protein ACQ4WX_21570 [Streptomyces lasalocidi]